MQLLKQQALAGDIVLLFADESEALTHPYLARAWARRGADLRVEALYGAKPGAAHKPIKIVLDNGPVHTSKATLAALAQRSHWLTPEWLAKYAPELNDIERSWQTLKAQRLAHKTFRDPDHLETTIHEELAAMNANQSCHPLANQRISA